MRELGTLPATLYADPRNGRITAMWVPTVGGDLLVGFQGDNAGLPKMRASHKYSDTSTGQRASAAPDGLQVFDLAQGRVVGSYSSSEVMAAPGSAKAVWGVVDGITFLSGFRLPVTGFDPATGRTTWTSAPTAGSPSTSTALALLGHLRLDDSSVLDLRSGRAVTGLGTLGPGAVPLAGPLQFAAAEQNLVWDGVHVFANNGFVAAMRGGVEVWSAKDKAFDAATTDRGLLVVGGTSGVTAWIRFTMGT